MGIARAFAVPLLLASAAAPAAAADPAPPAGWSLHWEDYHCTLTRQEGPAAFALRTVPGSGAWEVRLASRAWSRGDLRNARRLRISLQPADEALPEPPSVDRTRALGVLVIRQLRRTILSRLAAAQGVRAARGGEALLDMSLTGAAQAVAAVRQCEDRVMREWGVDPLAFAALRAPPEARNAGAVVSDSDYPQTARGSRPTGLVVARLTVEADGRVSDCVPVVSSGHAILDARTCLIYRQRLRPTPAVGADGAPTAAPLVMTLNWLWSL